MYFRSYDYITGEILKSISFLEFGDILQNQHSTQPVVFRAFSSETEIITDFKIYLENKGLWSDTQYGIYVRHSFTPSVESGSSVFETLTEVPDASPTSPDGKSIGWYQDNSDYVWLDIQIEGQTGHNEANYRFFYNYTTV